MKINPYKKKDGKTYYKFSININGKSTTRNGFKTKTDAQIAYARLKDRAEDINSFNFKFSEVYEMWIKNYKNTVRASTFNETEKIFINHILPKLGHLHIKKITLGIMQDAINDWATKLVNFKMVKNYTSNIFEYAIVYGYIKNNPCKNLIIPKKQEKEKKTNYFTKDELILFLKTAESNLDIMWFSFLYLLAMTGIRRGEALALNWSDFDFKNKTLNINKTLARSKNKIIVNPPKTKAGTRTIIIDKNTLKLLKKWKSKQKKMLKTNIVFTNTKGTYITMSQPDRKVKLICKLLNLNPISLHGLRHTHCSILFESGANIGEVQKRLGHTDVQTTLNIYNHVSKERDREVADKLNSYLNI